MRREVPILITIVVGWLMVLKFFLRVPLIEKIASEIEQWGIIVISFAVILGIGNILRVSIRAIRRREEGWGYKVVLLVSMLAVLGIGLFDMLAHNTIQFRQDGSKTNFFWVFENVLLPLQATMFGLLAFFIASAAFRAVRARTFEATLLLLAGVIIMIGRVPLGAEIHEVVPKAAEWIMEYPNTAGQRGIIMGAALGVIATGLRIICGIEKSYLSGG